MYVMELCCSFLLCMLCNYIDSIFVCFFLYGIFAYLTDVLLPLYLSINGSLQLLALTAFVAAVAVLVAVLRCSSCFVS